MLYVFLLKIFSNRSAVCYNLFGSKQMERIKLTIEYDGTNFSGYQVQPGKRTIQGEIEKALEKIYQQKVETFASGRTDAGVHAYGAVLHFDPPKELKNPKIQESINAYLPEDVKVINLEKVDESFDARFSSKKKTYVYKFYLSKFERPLLRNYALMVDDRVDVEKMKQACKYLVGERDYRSFVARKSGKTNFVRTIYSADIEKIAENEYQFKISGNGFLYNMVRIIMGTLINIGLSRNQVSDMEKIIGAKDRTKAGKTVKSCGLYLLSVDYGEKF